MKATPTTISENDAFEWTTAMKNPTDAMIGSLIDTRGAMRGCAARRVPSQGRKIGRVRVDCAKNLRVAQTEREIAAGKPPTHQPT